MMTAPLVKPSDFTAWSCRKEAPGHNPQSTYEPKHQPLLNYETHHS
jgi:hypothetical protein